VIYENLRDLQFEYRVGKLSDADYAQTKLVLQKELAQVIAETDRIVKGTPAAKVVNVAPQRSKAKAAFTCPHCGAEFSNAMRFCGQCGKEMA
jgi:NADH pyrophosphatase NudC (nudix superfamily)